VIIDPVISWVLRISLLFLFASSAFHKLRDVDAFRRAVWAYRLLPESAVVAAGPILVAFELVVVAALLLPGATAAAAGAVCVLLAVYSSAVAVNLLRGMTDVDCGCGGPDLDRKLSWTLIARNAIFATAALLMAWPNSGRPLGWVDGLSVIGFVTVVVASRYSLQLLAAVRHAAEADAARRGAMS
jgi:hypothetical protein